MFKRLADFGYRRSVPEAIGFYVAYFVLFLALSFLAGTVFGLVDADATWRDGLRIGNLVAIAGCLGVSFLILRAKGMGSSFGYVFVAILAGVFAAILGALAGLLPVAFLTTRPRADESAATDEAASAARGEWQAHRPPSPLSSMR